MDKYDPQKRVALIVDEWGTWYESEPGKGALYQQNTLRDALVAAINLNVFNRHAERVRMATSAQAINVLQALILTSQAGWQVMLYDKNVFNTTAITGDFLNSDDSGLTTNVFLTDPKLIGIRVTKNW